MIFQSAVDIREQINTSEFDYPYLGGAAPRANALGDIVSAFVSLAIMLGSIGLLIYLLWAGFNWLTSGGDKSKVEDARSRITNAIIGLAIIASAYAIYRLVDQFFGIGTASVTETDCPSGFIFSPSQGCIRI